MNHKSAIIYGLAIWAVTLIVAFLIFPLRQNERPLFESIMPVVLTAATTLFSYLYFKKVDKRFVIQGLCLGLIWIAISLVLDALMFSRGPMTMKLIDYIKDIGITYLIILIIPLGFGYLLANRLNNS